MRHRNRPGRIVKRLVFAVAVIVLLNAWYVGGFAAICWFSGRQQIKVGSTVGLGLVDFLHETVYAPLHMYKDSNLPGSSFPRRFAPWCYWHGADAPLTWEDVTRIDEEGIKGYSFDLR